MAKQPEDFKTAELPAIPTPVRRGRKPLGDKPMSAAQRKAASRKAARAKAAESFKSGDSSFYWPAQLSCTVDASTREKLKRIAAGRGCTVGQLLDDLAGSL